MPEHMRALIGSQNRLQEILECSRTQAWRIWTGKTPLTRMNEKYLSKVLQDEMYAASESDTNRV
jgi:hypothetical protein